MLPGNLDRDLRAAVMCFMNGDPVPVDVYARLDREGFDLSEVERAAPMMHQQYLQADVRSAFS